MNKTAAILILMTVGVNSIAQSLDPLIPSLERVKETNIIPSPFYNQRVAVIVSLDENENWKDLAEDAHEYLKTMGVDPVAYFQDQDICASPVIKKKFVTMMTSREIKSLLFIVGSGNAFQLVITEFHGKNNLISPYQESWVSSKGSLNTAFLSLGLKISEIRKVENLTNFLIPELPQVYEHVSLNHGGGLVLITYPSQLKRVKLAVETFEPLVIDESYPANVKNVIGTFNLEIERANQQLIEIFEQSYPYPYEFVSTKTNYEHYSDGYQYVMRSITTSGKLVKKNLNLKIDPNETDYISVKPGNGNGVELITLSVDEIITKFYVRQTVALDIYVGKHWDADITWQQSLTNFIHNMKSQLK